MPKKQQDGRYRAKITIGHDAAGKTLYKYVSGGTKRELEEAKAEARAYYIDGAVRQEDKLFDEYLVQWYKAKKEPFISASSREGYEIYINAHIIPKFGGRKLRAIQSMEIQQWLNSYAGKSKTAIVMVSSILKSMFASAQAEGVIERDPSLGLIKPKSAEPREKRAFTPEECVRIENTINTHKDGLFLAVLYYLGLRCGEALGLKWEDVNFADGVVGVQRDISYTKNSSGQEDSLKTRAAQREVPIPEPLYPVMQAVRGLPYMYLFGTAKNLPLPRTTFQRMWMALMVDTGFAKPVDRAAKRRDVRFDYECDVTPHFFRHNYATKLHAAGVDPVIAMRFLGHSNYATTAEIYTHPSKEHISKSTALISDGFKKLPESCQDEKRGKV